MSEIEPSKKRPRWHTVVLPWGNIYKEINLPKRNLFGHRVEQNMFLHSRGPNRWAEVSVHQTIKKNHVPFLPFLGGKTVDYTVKNYEIRGSDPQTINRVELKYSRHTGRVHIVDYNKDPKKEWISFNFPDLERVYLADPHIIHVRSVLFQA